MICIEPRRSPHLHCVTGCEIADYTVTDREITDYTITDYEVRRGTR
jgi:hypothetical protein